MRYRTLLIIEGLALRVSFHDDIIQRNKYSIFKPKMAARREYLIR